MAATRCSYNDITNSFRLRQITYKLNKYYAQARARKTQTQNPIAWKTSPTIRCFGHNKVENVLRRMMLTN